jgi:hypothetical protein
VDQGWIYETQASFTHPATAPDRTVDVLRPLADDCHPMWGIACHFPAWAADETDSTGDHWEIIPHVLLEEVAARFGFDPDETATVVDTVLHNKLPDVSDPLAYLDPQAVAALDAAKDIPDHRDMRLPYGERRQALLARVAVVKEHLVRFEAAPVEDRQGALDYRRAVIEDAVERFAAAGLQLPPQYLLGLDEIAPADPLALITAYPLDGNRVRVRRLRAEWDQAKHDRQVHPAVVATRGPQTFGMDRLVPPAAPRRSRPEVPVRRA